eukprot:6081298-Amphidinium_carterae.1
MNLDCIGIQEVGVTKTRTPRFIRAARCQNCAISFGATPCQRKDCLGRPYVQKQLGLGLFTRDSCCASKSNKQYCVSSEDALRISSWTVQHGPRTIHIHVVYLHWSTDAQWYSSNSHLLSLAVERITLLKGSCQILMGDFQTNAALQPELARFIHMGWVSAVLTAGLSHTNKSSH